MEIFSDFSIKLIFVTSKGVAKASFKSVYSTMVISESFLILSSMNQVVKTPIKRNLN